MRVAVCILHYGKAESTRRLHRQFLEADPGLAAHIRVLDNASPEPYPEAFLRLEENVFWGGALALMLDASARDGYTHLWFCNNDFTFVSEPPYLARVTARLRWLEKRDAEKGSRVGLYSPAATLNPYHRQMVATPGNGCRKVAYIDGIAPVISLDCARDIGGPDLGENPYGYGVDVWLSLRASRADWNVWVDDAVILRHKYHEAARAEDGYLARAAQAEDSYLTERLGETWRETLAGLQTTLETTA